MATNTDSKATPRPAPQRVGSLSQASESSQTAAEFISDQLQLEADAREALPYAFDTCTKPLGPLRQILFACLTCNPPPTAQSEPYIPAGVCYSCSISCHGEHTLVELFNKRNFVCDCGTTRLPSSTPCTLQISEKTGKKGDVYGEKPAAGNKYNQNFQNRFCGCKREYDAQKQKGTMYQCLGLGSADDGGCGEDWWHPGCVVGYGPDWYDDPAINAKKGKGPTAPQDGPEESNSSPDPLKEVSTGANETPEQGSIPSSPGAAADEDDDTPLPPGFPEEDAFETFICYKCVEANPWIKRYAGTAGFLPPAPYAPANGVEPPSNTAQLGGASSAKLVSSRKRNADEADMDKTDDSSLRVPATSTKRAKSADPGESGEDRNSSATTKSSERPCIWQTLPPARVGRISLFAEAGFREHLCRCANCFPKLAQHVQLLEEEESYEPPLSEDGDGEAAGGGSSVGTASLLDRGERALSNVDRVRAIEGVMVYNHLKEKVKSFLQPFAETGQAVGAEDIKNYFEKLRGDAEAVRAAGAAAASNGEEDGDNRREQSGY